MEQLVPIGRFSQLTRLSIKALRHYDRIGLLQPAEVDPSSGYRYYRTAQAREAEAIRLLRGVDMSLDDIATVLAAADNDDVVAKVLDRHHERLAEELEAHRRRLATVTRLIRGEAPVMPYDVTTKPLPELTIVSRRKEVAKAEIQQFFTESMGTIMGAISGGGGEMHGMPIALYHDVIDEESAGVIEVGIPVATPIEVGEGDVTCRTLPATTAAVTTHRGAYEEIAPAYHVVAGWITDHGHQPVMPAREVYLNDPTTVPEEEWLTEVQWPFQ